MLLTAHVQTVATFRDNVQGEAGEDGEFARRLRGEGVLIEPGRVFFQPGAERRNFYRLAYSSIQPAKIPEGMARIARAIRAG